MLLWKGAVGGRKIVAVAREVLGGGCKPPLHGQGALLDQIRNECWQSGVALGWKSHTKFADSSFRQSDGLTRDGAGPSGRFDFFLDVPGPRSRRSLNPG